MESLFHSGPLQVQASETNPSLSLLKEPTGGWVLEASTPPPCETCYCRDRPGLWEDRGAGGGGSPLKRQLYTEPPGVTSIHVSGEELRKEDDQAEGVACVKALAHESTGHALLLHHYGALLGGRSYNIQTP